MMLPIHEIDMMSCGVEVTTDTGLLLEKHSLLTPSERQQILVERDATQAVYQRDQCLHQLIEAQVERTPDNVAVAYDGTQLSYRELNQRANQLARYLQGLGVGPDVFVGLCVERSVEMLVGLLGILKAGGVYVPLDPTYPQERLAFLLQDTQAPILVTQERLLQELPEHQAHVVCLDRDWKLIAHESVDNNSTKGVGIDNLAYVIYTSGSTGKPKGVLVTHRNVVHSTYARILYYREPVKCFLLLSSFAFDSSVAGLFWTLCQGGTLLLPQAGRQAETTYLLELIQHWQVSHLLALPSLYALVLEQVSTEQVQSLHAVIVAGESCPRALVDRHYAQLAHCDLFNEYGPTEATVWCTAHHCQPHQTDALVPIGYPIPNMQIYLLDSQHQPVPIEVPGELYVGGIGLTQGYLHRPELTAERFIPHPFSSEPGTRLYRTGDLARYLSTGEIEFLGRVDHQVKIRGFRIELEEIEAALRQYPDVQEVVVLAREDVPGDQRLVAYIVRNQDQTCTSRDLRRFLKERLPDYMVPSAFVLLAALPLTPNGKLDRKALPRPDQVRDTTEETFVPPMLPLHHQLVEIWEDLLQVRPIGIRDNFFELGGHSLLAIQMMNRVAQVCGKQIPLATLFTNATIEHLTEVLETPATEIEQTIDSRSRVPLLALQKNGSKHPFFYLHGDWKGGSFYCLKLAEILGPEQPFYVLETYNFDGLPVPPTFEAIAAAHVEVIRAVQPEGPYLLGGFCNGALIAYEMAHQLHEAGQDVALLLLITPATPHAHSKVYTWIRRVGDLLRVHQEKQVDIFLLYRHLQNVWHSRRVYWQQTKQAGKRWLSQLFPSTKTLRQDWASLYDWTAIGYAQHQARHYPDKITLLWSEGEYALRGQWQELTQANEVEHYDIPGTHQTCRTEHVGVLAEQVKACLD